MSLHIRQICNFFKAWQDITSNQVTLDWVKGFKIPFHKIPVQYRIPKVPSVSELEKTDFSVIIKELFSKGILELCSSNDGFISPYFLVNKKDTGSKRFILNLKQLNTFVLAPHFKLVDIRTALKLLKKNLFLAKIDLKDAYYSVSIHKDFRKYLCFQFDGKVYQFTVLPFGLSVAPYLFTKLMNPLVSKLRSQGIVCIYYLDDWLLMAESHQECSHAIKLALSLLESLGFSINLQKSILTPSPRCQFVLDTSNMTIELPMDKRQKILVTLKAFKASNKVSIRYLAEVIGILVSACPAVRYGWLHIKNLERLRYLALLRNNNNFEAVVELSVLANIDLSWWEQVVPFTVNQVRHDKFDLTNTL